MSLDLALFAAGIVASIVCIAVPGPDMLGSLAMGLSRGRAAGTAFAIGVAGGCFTHTLFAVLGIAAIVAASAQLFTALKWIGAAYLVYLGIRALLSSGQSATAIDHQRGTQALNKTELLRILRDGYFSNVLNPKVMIFFIAFLPQFADVKSIDHPPVWLQLLAQGVIFSVITGVAYVSVALMAERVGRLLRNSPQVQAWMERATGATFIGMGSWLALSEKK